MTVTTENNTEHAPETPQKTTQQASTETPKPAPSRVEQGFTREYVHELREEAKQNRIAAQEAKTQAEKTQTELTQALERLKAMEQSAAVTTAAAGVADPALLLDSKTFINSLDGKTLTSDELKNHIHDWVTKNPAYAATPPLPASSGTTPTGGSIDNKPTSLVESISRRLSS